MSFGASSVMDSFSVMLDAFPTALVRRPPTGPDQTGLSGVWAEDRIDRDFNRNAERTTRTGTLQVLAATDYAWGEQWQINGEWWQVTAWPHVVEGVRILSLRRDDKVRTVSGRQDVL